MMVREMTSVPPAPTTEMLQGKNIENDGFPRQEIRLGILLPLSGQDAAIGKALLNAATLALFDAKDERLTLLPYDTQGTAEGAANAMTALLLQRPDLIIGPLFSHAITTIKPMAIEAGVNVIVSVQKELYPLVCNCDYIDTLLKTGNGPTYNIDKVREAHH